jgi:hypothetical protein
VALDDYFVIERPRQFAAGGAKRRPFMSALKLGSKQAGLDVDKPVSITEADSQRE